MTPVPAAVAAPASAPLGSASIRGLASCVVFAVCLQAGAMAFAQAPLQSPLPPTEAKRPQDDAQAALRAGNAARALIIAESALVTSPHDAQLRFARAVALNALGRLPEAETAFAEITREYPELPEPYNNLAVVRAAQGKLDQARIALEEAIRVVPRYAVAHENLGDVYVQLAARSYRTAQSLDPASKTIGPKLKLINEVPIPAMPSATAGKR